MRKFKNFFIYVLMILSLTTFTVTLSSCNNDGSSTNEDPYSKEGLNALKFEDLTINYDGKEHSIFVQDVPEGVQVTYVNNAKVKPGKYTVVAKITYGDVTVSKLAKLTIVALESVLTAPVEQTKYLYGGNVQFDYTLNNSEQEISCSITKDGQKISKSDLCEEGVYEVELYAPASVGYAESNHVKIKLTLINSLFDISFENASYVYDGEEKKIELTGFLPSGYTVSYENNVGTDAGVYYALAKINDASGNTIETHAATLSIHNPENEEFAQFLDEFFVTHLEGDQLSVNIFCENPSDFGLEHYDATWYTYESYTDEDVEDAKKQFTDLLAELEKFEDAKLNDLQEVAYNNIYKFLDYYIDFYSLEDANLMNIVYVDQFGGYVADFGTYMEAYSLWSEQEVQDIISYISSTKEAFPSYLNFVKDKADAGYALSDYTITEMRNYLKDLLDQDTYYLEAILNTKIDSLDFLTSDEKAEYKNQLSDAITNSFFPGVQELYDGLESHLGKLAAEDEGYWSVYEKGKEMYLLELQDLLGLNNFDEKAYIKEIETAFNSASAAAKTAQSALVNRFSIATYADLLNVVASHKIYDGTPEEMMEYLKEFAKTIVPELKSAPDIVIKNMDEASAKVSNAVAYYMKSQLDNSGAEYITLNPTKLGDSNDVLGTLAHEGYPGHLYAYVYSKEQGLSNLSTVMTSTAHGEGWATYVELKLYEYAKAQSTDRNFRTVMDYLYANHMSGFLLETRLDAGIHIQGWTVKDVENYLDKHGYNGDAAQEIYNLLIEMPSGYAAYGYGKLFFVNLHNEAKSILGGRYDEIEFNAMLLSKGWTSLGELQNTYDEYMKAKCHQYGLEYNK